MSRRARRSLVVSAAAVVVAAAAATAWLALGGWRADRPQPLPERAAAASVYHIDADHPVYANVGDLRAEADVVATGEVIGSSVVSGVSPGVDDAGDPVPAIPHTDYTVRLGDVIKGSVASGDQISVVLAGGDAPAGHFVLDGGPHLVVGDVQLLFLDAAPDGKFYPLAGGAAVASRQSDGSFLLSPEATGQEPIALTAQQLGETPPGPAPAPPTPAPAVPAPAPPSPATSAPATPSAQRLIVGMTLSGSQRLATILRSGLRLNVTCTTPCRASATLTLGGRAAVRLGLRRRPHAATLASGSASRSGTMTVAFTPRARDRLSTSRGVRLTLRLRVTGATRPGLLLTRRLRVTRRAVTFVG
ncbi:MAG TPA: hypothetical protein VKB03_04220 [Conexibacter sp.]|nr:hypothetical protein [Conexibacter sp.]